GLRGQDRAGPADGELLGVELLRLGAGGAEVEADAGVEAVEGALVGAEAAGVEILAAQAALVVPRAGGRAEAADEVGDGVAVLADGQAGQLDARRASRRV